MKIRPTPGGGEAKVVRELALARVLEECLEAMEQGEEDLDGLAARYPEAEKEIRPLLDVAQQLRHRRAAEPTLPPDVMEELREKLLAQPRR